MLVFLFCVISWYGNERSLSITNIKRNKQLLFFTIIHKRMSRNIVIRLQVGKIILVSKRLCASLCIATTLNDEHIFNCISVLQHKQILFLKIYIQVKSRIAKNSLYFKGEKQKTPNVYPLIIHIS